MPMSAHNTDKSKATVNSRPNVFIGIVSFVGIDTKPVVKSLEDSFRQFGYQPVHIKVSNAFKELDQELSLNILNTYEEENRVEKYIDCGDKLREKCGKTFLAQYAVSEIVASRPDDIQDSDNQQKALPTAYIIDQLKTEEEIELLKSVYGTAFFQISIYSARDRRVDYIAKQKAKTCNTRDSIPYRAAAEELVKQDYNEKDNEYGQRVGDIFPKADFIVNADNVEEHSIEQQIERFAELLFGSNRHSPNHMEYGMYLAHSAALRSLDLSRQVGAAICRPTGEIATLGCNEVPKAGGGTYWCDDVNHHDAREYKKGEDNNDKRKKELLNEVLAIFDKPSWENLSEEQRRELKKSQFMDALEYGRIVHAEMNAITDAARLGISLQKSTLYCTTFPCHMCSKLIIASGIKCVIFLEPYPKSLTGDMHPDAIKIEGVSREGYENYPAVEFSHFYGVTAQRYSEIFQRGKRKDDKGVQNYKIQKDDTGNHGREKNKASPIFAPYKTDDEMEDETAKKFNQIIKDLSTPYRAESEKEILTAEPAND